MKGLFYGPEDRSSAGSLQSVRLQGTNREFSSSLVVLSAGTVDPSTPTTREHLALPGLERDVGPASL